jgi:hypothetical protein
VPAALHHFDLAEQRLREHGAPVGELLADRAELLLSVRPDAETVPLMVAFHRRLAAGTPTIPAMAAAAGFIGIGTAPGHHRSN